MITFKKADEKKVSKIAQRFASLLYKGSVVLLFGDLGSGKTTFTRHLVAALGGNPRQVGSPTFTIVNEYNAKIKVYHIDLFRIEEEEVMELPIEEYLESDGICVIEWPEKLGMYTPNDFFKVKLEFLDELHRNLEIFAQGEDCARSLKNRGEFFAEIQET